MAVNPGLYALFVTAALLICVTPGPDMIYILTHGLSQGTRAALVAAGGMAAGMLCHTTAVVFGVATLVRSSPLAYEILRYAGAAYLAYMGVRTLLSTLRSHTEEELVTDAAALPTWLIFRRAALTNLLNPKILLFYLAFLPQFVSSSDGPAGVQLLVLGLTFVVLGLVVDGLIALLSGKIGTLLHRRPRASTWLDRFSGVVFLGLAARVAIA
ncbi:LysE family translocator [Solihabitans fulvus]|uniref:LysE family translocator n=1 Tax=Solihabitans fulvus TaxID=1892852 RepID=A0A5B2XF84_9PSEU|nr:LysE family translocator [Solihabitans fulvus]KAA2261462.1 LysE family translocator [Solihabitans fulvus]